MGPFDSRGDPAARSPAASLTPHVPASCPTCQSSSITTTANSPDVNSYWRCRSCGEIWNMSRRHGARSGADAWR